MFAGAPSALKPVRGLGLRRLWRALTLAVLLVGFTGQSYGQNKFDLDRTKSVLTTLLNREITRGTPSISIALVRGDAVVWKAACGYANVRTRTPATPDTLYSTGSTFKPVTATAILQLTEQGKLSLHDPVNAYLGDLRIQDRLQSEQAVTFEDILSHWSGLVGGAQVEPIWGRKLPKTLEAMVSGLYTVRATEVKYEYNNRAYGLAGLLVEKISGMEYEAYVLEHILKPLGVRTPHPVYPSAEMVELMALPYEKGANGKAPIPVQQVHFDVYPAGDVYLTAEDMARFLGAQLNGGVFNGQRILAQSSIEDMHRARFGGTYALGFDVQKDEHGHTIISHNGAIPGQSSVLLGDVEARVGVYMMSNADDGLPKGAAEVALQLLRGEP
jgi:serine-type D-Ala-D-Ala carboxypeptidase/endopeptidase